MLGDVGEPQFVRAVGGEPPPHQIRGGVNAEQTGPASPWPWQPGHAPLPHDRLDELVVDDHLVFFQQRRTDTSFPVDPARTAMDLLDGIGHDETTHLTGRHRAPSVELVGRPVQTGDPARRPTGMATRDQSLDDRDFPFGEITSWSLNNAHASRVNANSASS